MPSLMAHLYLADRAFERSPLPEIEGCLGNFLLGATAPDIRIITQSPREDTHFGPLTVDRIGTGAENLFRIHPELAETTRLNEATKAFLTGYLAHLVADEAWIIHMYRPYFGNPRLFQNHHQANLWDRALQLEMERLARSEMGDLKEIQEALALGDRHVDVKFLHKETISEWRDWVLTFTERNFDWQRLRFLAEKLDGPEETILGLVEEFLDAVPQNLERIYSYVPQEKMIAYQEKAIQESISITRSYLNGEVHTRGY